MRCLVLALAGSLVLSACGGGGGGGDDAPPGPADAPPLTGDKYDLQWGPVMVDPGVEGTQCVNIRLSNDAAIRVHQMRNILTAGSHHLIVYKVDDPNVVEATTPYDCNPFSGALNLSGTSAPVMITQKSEDALSLPDGVAYTFAANQMIRVEMHYINATDAPMMIGATSEFYTIEEAAFRDEANILFIGTPDISIPPGASMDVQAYFSAQRASLDLSGTKFFAITGHTHQYGTQVVVGTAATNGGPRTEVYAPSPFEWSEPETTVHSPEFTVPDNGGFDIKCSYVNTSNQTLGFGESANDEMCFFWAYYYPSKGSHVCVHSNYMGLDVDICCPDAGALCQMLEDQL